MSHIIWKNTEEIAVVDDIENKTLLVIEQEILTTGTKHDGHLGQKVRNERVMIEDGLTGAEIAGLYLEKWKVCKLDWSRETVSEVWKHKQVNRLSKQPQPWLWF